MAHSLSKSPNGEKSITSQTTQNTMTIIHLKRSGSLLWKNSKKKKKKKRNTTEMRQKMGLTLSLRRKEIVEMQLMVSEVQERWPALFSLDEVRLYHFNCI